MSSTQSQAPSSSRWASLADRLNPNRAAFEPKFQEEWKTLDKATKKKLLAQDRKKIKELQNRAQPLPFSTDENDHCETSKTAYQHIVLFLNLLANRLNKPPSELQIYDPYFCAGAVVRHLKELGFPNVHNQPDDFYQVIADAKVPPHDVLITNPPYSGDHFDKLQNFLSCQTNKPHLLLLPDHFQVNNPKDHYVFLKPQERYHYWTPRGLRPEEDCKKRKHRNLMLGSRNSPFPSQWCISLQPVVPKEELLHCMEGKLTEGCTLCKDATSDAKEGAKFNRDASSCNEDQINDNPNRKKKKKKSSNSKRQK